MGRRPLLTSPTSLASLAMRHLVARRFNSCASLRRSGSSSSLLASPTRTPLLLSRLLPHALGRSCDSRRSYASGGALNADFAVVGGGLTGLATAYYLAKKLPPSVNITLYEAGDRLGGWVRSERHPVDLGGKKGSVLFERGPRSLTSLSGNTWRYDDLVLYDLV